MTRHVTDPYREALTELIAAANTVGDWYHRGGDPNTERYKTIMYALSHAVQVWHQVCEEKVAR